MGVGSPLRDARQHRLHTIQRLNLRFLVDTRDNSPVRRRQIKADTVLRLVDERGSADSLKVSLRCGCRPSAVQIRRMVVCDKPVPAAMLRIDQRVASFGVVFSVRSITAATCAPETVHGRPGRCSSVSPSTRLVTKRQRPAGRCGHACRAVRRLPCFGTPLHRVRIIRP